MRIHKIVLSILLMSAFHVTLAQPAQDYVYKIIISTSSQSETTETGFKIKGKNTGIITCLHGVASGKYFTALGEKKVFRNLTITVVDIEHDLVLLQSAELNQEEGGLEIDTVIPSPYKKLKVLGYPAGVGRLNEKTVTMGNPATGILGELMPTGLRTAFEARKSPSLNSKVLYVEGQMIPGHSGAPLLGPNNTVHGIVIGGIEKGSAGITWAMPVSQIRWKAATAVAKEIYALGQKNASSLFAVTDGQGQESDGTGKDGKPLDMNGPWELVQRQSRTLHADGTLDNTHWTVKAQLSLAQDGNKITGKYSSRATNIKTADVTGTISGQNIRLTIVCTEGHCAGSGMIVTGKYLNGTIVAKVEALENRPPKCIIHIGQEVTLKKN